MDRARSMSVLFIVGLLLAGCTAGGPTHKARASGSPSTDTSVQAAAANGGPPSNAFADSCTIRAGRLVTKACARGQKTIKALWERPLHLPALRAGGSCPTSRGRTYSNGQFAGVALGISPVRPIVDAPPAAAVHGRALAVRRDGWWSFKTLWFALPRYQGPFLIRGANLATGAPVRFGEGTTTPAIAVRAQTLNGDHGFREAPGGTYVKMPGCYGWQVDGIGFSRVIVFQAQR